MIKQCVIVFGCLALGEFAVSMTGLKLPSSIIGMILLTVFLKLGWIKLKSVKGISDFLAKNLALFFVPSGVAIMLYLDILKDSLLPIIVASIGSTIIILAVTGWVHQIIRKKL
ncbi:CidA/LrgA family protein [Pararcticibacter amylolyticus]|uniref:CidA/LrgA family protein n=1 Tax=Pararcticibacter amylolyticus TaxID=2173175 RepID=A0A2U2PG98_9SPHI|nr:CidA/LrgA family protein [Pararcticibacter amylolyticus]PWG80354.1 CidA/LrgA family protein [Pararcticibacter amylolyticus]